jgi:hypothetical protein
LHNVPHSFHIAGVPDSPKTLIDLRATDAAVRLRCTCGREEVHDREKLIGRYRFHRHSLDLSAVSLSCGRSDCEGQRFVEAVPWSDDPAKLKRRVAHLTMINLSCEVLEQTARLRIPRQYGAAPFDWSNTEWQPAARLALRVVAAFGASVRGCTEYWENLSKEDPRPWESGHDGICMIVNSLVKLGWNVNVEYRRTID